MSTTVSKYEFTTLLLLDYQTAKTAIAILKAFMR